MIDLNRFNQTIKTIVPVLNHSFRYKSKRYKNISEDNGWYEVNLTGNKCEVIGNIVTFEVTSSPIIKGYIYEDNLIFENFDIGKRKVGQEVMDKIYFNHSPELSAVEAVLWEDGFLYYKQPNYTEYRSFSIASGDDVKTIKGITPELRTLALFMELKKQKLEELKRIEDQKELAKTIQGRLVLSLQRVGAELLDYSVQGDYIAIDWSIGSRSFNSLLEKDTFKVVEAGYCMTGHDKEHSLHSMAILAQEYEKDNLIYRTRGTERDEHF